MTFPVTVTQKAIDKFKEGIAKRGGGSIRLGVIGGGCSGFQYTIAFEDSLVRDTDLLLEDGAMQVRIDPKSAKLLEGSTLDFIETGLIGRGFSFKNPQEKSRCGCGTSFSA